MTVSIPSTQPGHFLILSSGEGESVVLSIITPDSKSSLSLNRTLSIVVIKEMINKLGGLASDDKAIREFILEAISKISGNELTSIKSGKMVCADGSYKTEVRRVGD